MTSFKLPSRLLWCHFVYLQMATEETTGHVCRFPVAPIPAFVCLTLPYCCCSINLLSKSESSLFLMSSNSTSCHVVLKLSSAPQSLLLLLLSGGL